MAHQKPRNADRDSASYSLPHDVSMIITELAKLEKDRLDVASFSTSDYLTRLFRQMAKQELSEETRATIDEKARQRTEERLAEGAAPPGTPRRAKAARSQDEATEASMRE